MSTTMVPAGLVLVFCLAASAAPDLPAAPESPGRPGTLDSLAKRVVRLERALGVSERTRSLRPTLIWRLDRLERLVLNPVVPERSSNELRDGLRGTKQAQRTAERRLDEVFRRVERLEGRHSSSNRGGESAQLERQLRSMQRRLDDALQRLRQLESKQ